jgi:hypothetical protein
MRSARLRIPLLLLQLEEMVIHFPNCIQKEKIVSERVISIERKMIKFQLLTLSLVCST